MNMLVVSTIDVPEQALEELVASLAPKQLHLSIDNCVVLKSAEPPSWISLLADPPVWLKVLAGYGALYIAEIVKEAGKETWRNRGKVIDAAISAGNGIKYFAHVLSDLRKRVPLRTTLEVGLPIPDDYFATRLKLEGADAVELAPQIALFLHHLPSIQAIIVEEGLSSDRVATGIFLELRDDGGMLVSWIDEDSHQVNKRLLPLLGIKE